MVGQRLSDAVTSAMVSVDQTQRPLGELLTGPAVLVVLRHFGCAGCDQHVTELRPHLQMFVELGLVVVLVGNGEPHHAQLFGERHHLPERGITLATDPSHLVHAALELENSRWSSLGPRALYGWFRALGRGYRQEGWQGDIYQQGGAWVIDADHIVRFHHRSSAVGDDADVSGLGRHALSLAVTRARDAGYPGTV